MRRSKGNWKAKAFATRVSRWVAAELAKGSDCGAEWCETLAERSIEQIGTFVPAETIRAHVFAIQSRSQKRRRKTAIGGTGHG